MTDRRARTTRYDVAAAHGVHVLARAYGIGGSGDGRLDLAVPSLDRRALRFITFMRQPRDMARVPLPARVATNIGAITFRNRSAVAAGLENGQLILVHD